MASDRFLYTGKELDTGTGLEYYGARYYDPVNGSQFTQPDSVIADPYDPQSLNRYSYVLNNPYKYTDPDGNVAVLAPLLVYAATQFAIGFTVSSAIQYATTGQIDIGESVVAGGVSIVVPKIASGVLNIKYIKNIPLVRQFAKSSINLKDFGINYEINLLQTGSSAVIAYPIKNIIQNEITSDEPGIQINPFPSQGDIGPVINPWALYAQNQNQNQPTVWGPSQANANAPNTYGSGSGGSVVSSNSYTGLDILHQSTGGPTTYTNNNNQPDSFEQNKLRCGCDTNLRYG